MANFVLVKHAIGNGEYRRKLQRVPYVDQNFVNFGP